MIDKLHLRHIRIDLTNMKTPQSKLSTPEQIIETQQIAQKLGRLRAARAITQLEATEQTQRVRPKNLSEDDQSDF